VRSDVGHRELIDGEGLEAGRYDAPVVVLEVDRRGAPTRRAPTHPAAAFCAREP
jgi:hypothetical protein